MLSRRSLPTTSIGDAVKPGKVDGATRGGCLAAVELFEIKTTCDFIINYIKRFWRYNNVNWERKLERSYEAGWKP